MTAEYIAFHAAERPDAVAIVSDGTEVTYTELSAQIRKFTKALQEFALPRGARAIIDCDDAYYSWLLRLACEQLGIVTLLMRLLDDAPASLLQGFALVISDKIFRSGDIRCHQATPRWLHGIAAAADPGEQPALRKGPDDPLRIVMTSGTTGERKQLLYTRRIHDASITTTAWATEFTRHSRYLLVLPSIVGGPTACIRAGGTVIIENRMGVSEAIATHAITHTTLPPQFLKLIVDELPQNFVKPESFTIFSLGAAVSPPLRERVLARLATALCDIYSSNEVGNISLRWGADEFGVVCPGVRVEVVDDRDQPLPLGTVGRIRVRTGCMVDGYLDRTQDTAHIFKDGWFYPGDAGILREPRRLQVIGRHDDLLNIGWRKIAPEAIEELVLKATEVGDAAVCSIANADGIEEVCIAVSGTRIDDDELVRRITETLRGFQLGKLHVIELASIPRTPNGKIQRRALKEMFAVSIRGGR